MMQIQNVRLNEDETAVVILDQSRLPDETVYLTLSDSEKLFEAISTLKVRGAPAIGIFAAYALYILAKQLNPTDYNGFYRDITALASYLESSRPTAVNLSKQLGRMISAVKDCEGRTVSEILDVMRDEAIKIHNEDIAMCRAISEHGLTLIRDGYGILTHCNAGPLATSRYGTGLGAILLAKERGMNLRVFCDETRPLLQGARITAYELFHAKVDCTLICDNMASLVMREGKIDAVFVGCDRVARNGDTANKIGTSGAAILAKHYNIPFYVFCPSSTLDPDCETGADIEIELRSPEEITGIYFKKSVAPQGIKCYNPAFDVTDAELISAIITEKGILRPPYIKSIREAVG